MIALLSSGMSRKAACKAVGVGYTTATKWAEDPSFAAALAAEIERREQRIIEALREAADEQIQAEVSELASELAAYKKAVVSCQVHRLNLGRDLSNKALRRLRDLPDESLSASDSIRLLTASDGFLGRGLELWGHALAVDDLMKHFEVEDEAL
jgi:hypothetical protein